MKVILPGYKATQKIITACSYLVDKYLGKDFDVRFVNIGPWKGKLYCGSYDDMGGVGPSPEEWMKGLISYLKNLDDRFIVWGSDEFFLSRPVDLKMYERLFDYLKSDSRISCAKLCVSNFHKPSEYEMLDEDVFMLNSTAQYSTVVQYAIWKREDLIHFLELSSTPWDFERDGSQRFNSSGKKSIASLKAPFVYPTRTATSGTHPGKVSVLGNKNVDVDFLIKQGHLKEDELIMGLWPGASLSYKDGKKDHYACLKGSPDEEYSRTELALCLS